MNDVKLQEGHPVDENLRPLKVGGESTAIETAQYGNGARVNGDLEITGTTFASIDKMYLGLVPAYAGMILGYTDIGLNESHASLNLTTSYVVPTDEFSVSFVVPPSGNVSIDFQIQYYMGSSGAGTLHAGLSTANATSGYAALEAYHEQVFDDTGARIGVTIVHGQWTITGLTAGTSTEYWIGFKSLSTTGTPKIQWGGNVSGRYSSFIMKATALPATITT